MVQAEKHGGDGTEGNRVWKNREAEEVVKEQRDGGAHVGCNGELLRAFRRSQLQGTWSLPLLLG